MKKGRSAKPAERPSILSKLIFVNLLCRRSCRRFGSCRGLRRCRGCLRGYRGCLRSGSRCCLRSGSLNCRFFRFLLFSLLATNDCKRDRCYQEHGKNNCKYLLHLIAPPFVNFKPLGDFNHLYWVARYTIFFCCQDNFFPKNVYNSIICIQNIPLASFRPCNDRPLPFFILTTCAETVT